MSGSATRIGIAVVVLSGSALPVARRLVAALPGAELHSFAGRVDAGGVTFPDTAAHLRGLFEGGAAIVGLCAAGVLIRSLAPVLRDKRTEPPVLAVAEDGSTVVPLLGGHHGANDLARAIGRVLEIPPAITTAGDLRFGVALDEPPLGYRLANPEDVKPFTAALLAGERVRIDGEVPWPAANVLPIDPNGSLRMSVTEKTETGSARRLVYHPQTIAVGVGCERGADPAELVALVETCLAEAGLAREAVAGLFSLDLKADEPAIHAVAEALAVPARFFTAAQLEAEAPRLANPSEAVFREVGCHGVAEGAAMAAIGVDGVLIRPKRVSGRVTCALARASKPLDACLIGKARGSLFMIGTGPGDPAWLTPEARRLLLEASDLVGYRLYLDLLGPLAQGKRRHDFALGDEEARVRAALALASEGRTVALVSSGDPGIYAMAALAFELVEHGAPNWKRVEIRVAPGISAMQAAAARIGSPLGHDFCAISLSDLLTPWVMIERRLQAAAEGDFVVALYNPASRRRTRQLEAARAILLRHRPPDTPVVLARNLGRIGETIRVIRLDALTPSEVDMLTLVLIGSSATRIIARGDGGFWVYTPRGYGTGDTTRKEAG